MTDQQAMDESGSQVDLQEMELRYTSDRENFQPWVERSEFETSRQRVYRDILRRRAGAVDLAPSCFIAVGALVFTDRLSVGDRTWIAAGAIIRGNVSIGSNSSVNPYAHIAGKVQIGNGVRIASLVSIYGFNHGFARVDVPIYQQPLTSKGVVIGDGSWVGANTVIMDGVSIGEHCVIGAGSVVTKDVPPYSVTAGNPARVIRNRRAEIGSPIDRRSAGLLKVRDRLYDKDPYIDLPFSFPLDTQGWDSEHAIFAETISQVRPKLIVEVGTWKGASAIHMAKICRSLGLQTEVVCIDTWLGNWQHWSRDSGGIGSKEDLKIVNGLPRLYYQFMSNVIHTGFESVITPLPLTGVAGAKLFEHIQIFPDIVYIDGDHEYESVLFDIRLWLKQVAPSGVLIGDDYNWPTVKRAVDEIAAKEHLIFQTVGQKFTLRRAQNNS